MSRHVPYHEATHLVTDIETLGKKPGCVILSIGAVSVSEEGTTSFYDTIKIDSCVDLGLSICTDTMGWWNGQHKEVRDAAMEEANDIISVLTNYNEFIMGVKPDYTWGNAPSFDQGIIAEAMSRIGMKPAWEYYEERDVRTLLMPGLISYDEMNAIKQDIQFVPHHALSDAQYEARKIVLAIDKLSRGLGFITDDNLDVAKLIWQLQSVIDKHEDKEDLSKVLYGLSSVLLPPITAE